jgi:rubrerythrin
MEITRDQIIELAKIQAQIIVEKLHRYSVTYQPPETVDSGLRESMGEELTAANWYRERAKHARINGRSATAGLYEKIADEEDEHYREFAGQLRQVTIKEMVRV